MLCDLLSDLHFLESLLEPHQRGLLTTPIYGWGNWGSEQLKTSPRSQNSEAVEWGPELRSTWPQSLCPFTGHRRLVEQTASRLVWASVGTAWLAACPGAQLDALSKLSSLSVRWGQVWTKWADTHEAWGRRGGREGDDRTAGGLCHIQEFVLPVLHATWWVGKNERFVWLASLNRLVVELP